jgi:hypothetical protein
MTQVGLAQQVGHGETWIGMLERGKDTYPGGAKFRPSAGSLYRVAEAIGMDQKGAAQLFRAWGQPPELFFEVPESRAAALASLYRIDRRRAQALDEAVQALLRVLATAS